MGNTLYNRRKIINHDILDMKLNKYIVSSLLFLGTTGVLTSCNDWLKEDPKSFIGPESVGNSKEAIDIWVTGVYSNWLDDMFRWSEFPRVLELDNDYISGPDWLFGYLGAGNFQGEESLKKMWTGPYNLINDANLAIENVKGMSGDEAFNAYRDNALGELYFQKAFAYFMLVRAYGPIPVFTTDVSHGNTYYEPRRPVAEVYDHIIDLLTQAQELMYNRDNSNYKAGHVCAGSAAGLLAKVYATMASAAMPAGTELIVRTGPAYENGKYRAPEPKTFGKKAVAGYEEMDSQALYEKAAYWAKRVIDGEYGGYTLLAYDDLWSRSHRNDSEFMWGIQSTNGDETYCMHIHTYYSGYYDNASSQFISSGGWVGNTNNWYSLFDDNDYRVLKGVRHVWRYYYQEEGNGAFFYPQKWSAKVTGYDTEGNKVGEPDPEYAALGYNFYYNLSNECLAFTTKYDDVTDKATDYADSQWPFLRYADVLLIYAEAQNELGNAAEAVRYLNMVRNRSNAALMTTTPQKTALRSSILEERAKEFACEGDRRWDIIRWGIYLDCMNAIGHDDSNVNKERTERNLLYPIPTDEMNVNTAIKENNPGWN